MAHQLRPQDVMGDVGDVVRRAQEVDWFAETPMGKAVLHYDKVLELLRDRRFRNMGMDQLKNQGVLDGPIYETCKGFLLSKEGQEHVRMKGLVRGAFTPRSVDRRRPQMRDSLHTLLDRVADKREFDFVAAVAEPFPARVFSRMLGLPLPLDDPEFRQWCADLGHIVGLEISAHHKKIEAAITGLRQHIEPVIAARKAVPEDDLITALLSAEHSGDRLSDDELVGQIIALIFGGLDTTRRTIGNTPLTLLQHRDQWRLLREQPQLAKTAAEEILRYAPGTRVAIRVARFDLEFHGIPICAGEMIIAATGIANRDPRVFKEADTLDITRTGPAPLSLGGGPHYCLGAYLARAELQEALPILTARLADAELCGTVKMRAPLAGSPGPETIPLRCHVQPR